MIAERRGHEDADLPVGRGEAGFTLLEILVVIAILGLLISLVAPAVLRQLEGAKLSIAKQAIGQIEATLDQYKLEVGGYPTTEQGLQALITKPADADGWNGPYFKNASLPIDPWKHPFIYRSPSERENHEFDVCSLGPDGKATGTAQICNP